MILNFSFLKLPHWKDFHPMQAVTTNDCYMNYRLKPIPEKDNRNRSIQFLKWKTQKISNEDQKLKAWKKAPKTTKKVIQRTETKIHNGWTMTQKQHNRKDWKSEHFKKNEWRSKQRWKRKHSQLVLGRNTAASAAAFGATAGRSYHNPLHGASLVQCSSVFHRTCLPCLLALRLPDCNVMYRKRTIYTTNGKAIYTRVTCRYSKE